ncbi:MAG TPA: hypothetical protein VHO25_19325 [Polyangiaceae bacterium]|nr:hypothetical protein [Polyangiaceae bacterium]
MRTGWLASGVVAVLCLVFVACSGDDDDKGEIGARCTASSDCGDGLSCSNVTVGAGRTLMQCSSYCNDSDECSARHGGSFCIGTNYCVRSCRGVACPSGYSCNSNGWCE